MPNSPVDITFKGNVVTLVTNGKLLDKFAFDTLSRILRVDYGDSFSGAAPDSFWIFELPDRAIVLPDRAPAIRKDLLKRISPSQLASVALLEGTCRRPPKEWSAASHNPMRPEVQPMRIDKEALTALAHKHFPDLHKVDEFTHGAL